MGFLEEVSVRNYCAKHLCKPRGILTTSTEHWGIFLIFQRRSAGGEGAPLPVAGWGGELKLQPHPVTLRMINLAHWQGFCNKTVHPVFYLFILNHSDSILCVLVKKFVICKLLMEKYIRNGVKINTWSINRQPSLISLTKDGKRWKTEFHATFAVSSQQDNLVFVKVFLLMVWGMLDESRWCRGKDQGRNNFSLLWDVSMYLPVEVFL